MVLLLNHRPSSQSRSTFSFTVSTLIRGLTFTHDPSSYSRSFVSVTVHVLIHCFEAHSRPFLLFTIFHFIPAHRVPFVISFCIIGRSKVAGPCPRVV